MRIPLEHNPPALKLRIVHLRQLLELSPRLASARPGIAVKHFRVREVSEFEFALLVDIVKLRVASSAGLLSVTIWHVDDDETHHDLVTVFVPALLALNDSDNAGFLFALVGRAMRFPESAL
jgi:hypothetical protein